MSSIINLVPTTELEAVNSMLSAIGEAPITNVDTATQGDVAMAVNTLRDVTREVQSMGWKFNTEFGFQLAPFTTYSFVDTATTTLLNIFKPATNLIGFSLTVTSEQMRLDMVIRPSRKYVEATFPVLVFYDRSLNRDGLDASQFPYLYINPVWLFDFEKMPEVARRYCTIRATRQFVERAVGSDTLAGFTREDERLALRNLKRDHGDQDDYNMLNNMSVLRHFGMRPVAPMGMTFDTRKSPA